jgi:hypothetical protein
MTRRTRGPSKTKEIEINKSARVVEDRPALCPLRGLENSKVPDHHNDDQRWNGIGFFRRGAPRATRARADMELMPQRTGARS